MYKRFVLKCSLDWNELDDISSVLSSFFRTRPRLCSFSFRRFRCGWRVFFCLIYFCRFILDFFLKKSGDLFLMMMIIRRLLFRVHFFFSTELRSLQRWPPSCCCSSSFLPLALVLWIKKAFFSALKLWKCWGGEFIAMSHGRRTYVRWVRIRLRVTRLESCYDYDCNDVSSVCRLRRD